MHQFLNICQNVARRVLINGSRCGMNSRNGASGLFMVSTFPAALPVTATPALTPVLTRLPVNVLLFVAPKATSAINKYLFAPVARFGR